MPPPRKYLKHRELIAGWQWFSLHRRALSYLVDTIQTSPEIMKSFHHSFGSDEIVFHMILDEHTQELNINRENSLRYIDWHPTRPYKTLPLVLNEMDYERIRISGALICRKVIEGESDKLLDLLDENL